MDYIELRFSTSNDTGIIRDILSAELAEIGFESFVEEGEDLLAYIPQNQYNELLIQPIVNNIPLDAEITFQTTLIKAQNWNEEWEKNYFQPIVINNKCVVHSTFHKNVPQAEYDILIDPKMSFGTGHHETTSLVIGELLKNNLVGKSLLDMGCGTCILGILASMCGANPITAIDIDEWCVENSLENLKLNHINNVEVLLGDAGLLINRTFDVILANINRNILLNDIKTYAQCLPQGGELYMSGFYKTDIPAIEAECDRNGLKLSLYAEKNNWVVTVFVKGC